MYLCTRVFMYHIDRLVESSSAVLKSSVFHLSMGLIGLLTFVLMDR